MAISNEKHVRKYFFPCSCEWCKLLNRWSFCGKMQCVNSLNKTLCMAALKENEGFRGREENHEHVMLIFFPQKNRASWDCIKNKEVVCSNTRRSSLGNFMRIRKTSTRYTFIRICVCTTFSPKLQAQKQHLKKIRKLVFPESRLSWNLYKLSSRKIQATKGEKYKTCK